MAIDGPIAKNHRSVVTPLKIAGNTRDGTSSGWYLDRQFRSHSMKIIKYFPQADMVTWLLLILDSRCIGIHDYKSVIDIE